MTVVARNSIAKVIGEAHGLYLLLFPAMATSGGSANARAT